MSLRMSGCMKVRLGSSLLLSPGQYSQEKVVLVPLEEVPVKSVLAARRDRFLLGRASRPWYSLDIHWGDLRVMRGGEFHWCYESH